jgi:hypothetical protein
MLPQLVVVLGALDRNIDIPVGKATRRCAERIDRGVVQTAR